MASSSGFWGTAVLLFLLYAGTNANKSVPLEDIGPFEFAKKPPPPTNADFRSLRRGKHATPNAALNAVVFPTLAGLRCVSVLDPQLLEEDLDAVERSSMQSVILDEYVYYNNREDETALCDELLVPFEFEDAWFLAWYKRGKLNFLAEEDLVEEPIGKKVEQAVRMLYPERTITSTQPHYCAESRELRKIGDGTFIGHQATLILTHEAFHPRAVCNGKSLDASTAFLMRTGLIMKYPAAGRKYLLSLPEPEFDQSQPDQVFMLKLANGFKTRTFTDGKWGPEIDFEESFVSELYDRCADSDLKDSYECHEHLNLKSIGGESINLANGVFIDKTSDDDENAESWFCAHSWSVYGRACLLLGGESCFRHFKSKSFKDNQDAFVCKRLPKVFSLLMRIHVSRAIVPYQKGAPEGEESGAIIDLDGDHQLFSALTRFKVVLQKPQLLPESYTELFAEQLSMLDLLLQQIQPKDVYTQLANSTGEVFMVMAKNDPKRLRNSQMDADGFVLNVLSSIHPLFSNPSTDNTKLAFNAPKDKVHGPFWVCLGDFSRESAEAMRAGGTYCIQDEALNRDLRCSSVVGPIVKEDPKKKRSFVFVDIEDIPYEDWYSDCPRTIRGEVLQEVEHVLENPEEYHSAENHHIHVFDMSDEHEEL